MICSSSSRIIVVLGATLETLTASLVLMNKEVVDCLPELHVKNLNHG